MVNIPAYHQPGSRQTAHFGSVAALELQRQPLSRQRTTVLRRRLTAPEEKCIRSRAHDLALRQRSRHTAVIIHVKAACTADCHHMVPSYVCSSMLRHLQKKDWRIEHCLH